MKYVALLRPSNVAGHAIIKMADLKKMFEVEKNAQDACHYAQLDDDHEDR